MENGYAIVKDGKTCYMICDDLTTAIKMVQSLEESLDRYTQHSPYTIVKESHLTKAQRATVCSRMG